MNKFIALAILIIFFLANSTSTFSQDKIGLGRYSVEMKKGGLIISISTYLSAEDFIRNLEALSMKYVTLTNELKRRGFNISDTNNAPHKYKIGFFVNPKGETGSYFEGKEKNRYFNIAIPIDDDVTVSMIIANKIETLFPTVKNNAI